MKRSLDHAVRIACAVNRSYLLPLAVMLRSLQAHLRPQYKCELYLLHTGIPDQSLAVIPSTIETHSILLSKEQMSGAPRAARFPHEASAPLLLPDLLPPAVERVLFLDADLLVMRDVAELWETPLDGRVVGAVGDAAVPQCAGSRGVKGWQALGLPPDAAYFNCGVLLIHLGRWRERHVTGRALRYLETTREPIDFLHQEALNAVLWDDWKSLDPCWNLLASRAGRSFDRSGREDWKQPGIVHFAGRMKPWRTAIGGPFNTPYQRVLADVAPLMSPEPANLADRFAGLYDRHLRCALHPLEQFLWRHRVL